MIAIYGNGSMAKVLNGYKPAHAFVVDRACIPQDRLPFFQGKNLIALDQMAVECPTKYWSVLLAVGFVGMNEVRKEKFHTLQAMGYELLTYLHPSVQQIGYIHVGEGSVLLDHITLHPDTLIGQGVWMTGHNAIGHDCRIGSFCWINSGVTLAGNVTVGEGSFIGVNACVADGVHIGKRNYIGAGTHIAHDTLDDQVHITQPGTLFRMKSKDFLEFIQ